MESQDYFGPNNKFVKELVPSDFDSAVPWQLKSIDNKKVSGLVLFYAPWCPHCKVVAPEWEKAGKMSGFCDFYAFNCEKNKNHVMKIKEDMPELIQGYPSIIYYENGVPGEAYVDPRDAKSFVKYCMNKCSTCNKK